MGFHEALAILNWTSNYYQCLYSAYRWKVKVRCTSVCVRLNVNNNFNELLPKKEGKVLRLAYIKTSHNMILHLVKLQ